MKLKPEYATVVPFKKRKILIARYVKVVSSIVLVVSFASGNLIDVKVSCSYFFRSFFILFLEYLFLNFPNLWMLVFFGFLDLDVLWIFEIIDFFFNI